MARVTVEDCLDKVPNRFALVVLAAERARQLSRGANPGVDCDNKPAVTALREIAAGLVTFREDVRNTVIEFIVERRTLARGELVALVYRLGHHAASGVLTLTARGSRPEVFVLRRGAAVCGDG